MASRVSAPPRRRTHQTPLEHSTTIQRFQPTSAKPVALAWSPSGTFLAVAIQHGTVLLFFVLPGKQGAVRANPIRTFRAHTADVLHLVFSRSDFLLTASMDRSVRLWHADTSLCLRRFLHPDMVTCVAFHPVDENFVVTAGCDGVARVWRPADHACVAQLDVGAVATAIEFSPDGTCAFVGTYDARIVTLDLKDIITDGKSALASHPNSSSPLQSKVSLSPMTSSNDNLNSAPLLKMRHSIDIHHRRKRKRSRGPKVGGLCADTRSNRIYSISSDARIHVLNDDGNVHARFRAPARKESSRKEGSVLLSPTISPDGKYILHDAVGGVVRLIKLPVARKADAKRRERETSIGVEHVIALETANVSCAAFASFAVLENARPGRDNRRRFIMAVGGDDGSVSIIENAYR